MTQCRYEAGDLDKAFRMLGKRRRRRLLLALLSGDSLTETDLIDRLDGEREYLLVDLRHTDLPKLSQADYIAWEQDTGLIRRGPRFAEIKPLLEWCATHADSLPGDSSA